MTDAPTGHFQSIVLQPHAGQFVIDELPAIVLCCTAWVYGGMEGLPLTALAVPVAALLSLALLYRFIYLRRTRYHIGSEQLISRHGVLSRKTDYMEQYRIVDFCGTPKPHAAALRPKDGTHPLDGQEYTPA